MLCLTGRASGQNRRRRNDWLLLIPHTLKEEEEFLLFCHVRNEKSYLGTLLPIVVGSYGMAWHGMACMGKNFVDLESGKNDIFFRLSCTMCCSKSESNTQKNLFPTSLAHVLKLWASLSRNRLWRKKVPFSFFLSSICLPTQPTCVALCGYVGR